MLVDHILEAISHLSDAQKWQLVKYLIEDLEPREATKTTEQQEWASFVNCMYGALADDPIERPPQLPLTERDAIE